MPDTFELAHDRACLSIDGQTMRRMFYKWQPDRRRPARLAWVVSGLTAVADQLTKQFVIARFVPGESLPLLPPLLHLTYVQNTGAAFGLFKGQQRLFVIMAVVMIFYLFWMLRRGAPMNSRSAWACALALGGAVGNLIDRVRLGYVIDFIDLRVWPVFNLGDSAITVGVVLLLLESLRAGRRRAPEH